MADAMRYSFDGFPARAPGVVRVLGGMFKRRVLSKPFQPGFKLGAKAESKVWNDAASFEDGVTALRTQIARACAEGSAPCQPHPFFGPMTCAEWQAYYLRHAELHLSFLQP